MAFPLILPIPADYKENSIGEIANDSSAAILSMVPPVYRKYLTTKSRNQSISGNSNSSIHSGPGDHARQLSIDEMRQYIARYNELQTVLNEETFGPLQNDSVIIVVQVRAHHSRTEVHCH